MHNSHSAVISLLPGVMHFSSINSFQLFDRDLPLHRKEIRPAVRILTCWKERRK